MIGDRGALLRPASTRWWQMLEEERAAVAGFALAMAVFYVLAGPGQHMADGWFPLAEAFLHGRLWIDGSRPWVEAVPAGPGMWYLPFPPVPAVVLMPIVALVGPDVLDTSAVTGVAGGICVALVWVLLRRLGLTMRTAAWLTVSFALGSEVTYAAATAGVHLWTETLGLTFALGALVLAVRGQWPVLGGVLLALAAGCRPPYALAGFALLALYAAPLVVRAGALPVPTPDERTIRRAVLFCAGAIPVGLLILAYNVARFGTPFEFGYDLIVGQVNGASVLSEPWYANGIESITYIPRGLYTMLFRGFSFSESPPWLQPSLAGTSILLTMPLLAYLVRAMRAEPVLTIGWLGLVIPLLLDLMHGNPGYAQWGYRFFLDGLPFAWLLLGVVAGSSGFSRGMKLAIGTGIAVNLYGLACVGFGFVAP